ncbi:MAG: hypothetical protein Q8O40_14320 [Chloroflexota bacterium]|nr:hypothetical protein [Chloroflexota bacterium]
MLAAAPLAAAVVGWYSVRKGERGGPAIARIVRLVAAVAILAGWWYIRNWWLYGDLLGLNVFIQASGRNW